MHALCPCLASCLCLGPGLSCCCATCWLFHSFFFQPLADVKQNTNNCVCTARYLPRFSQVCFFAHTLEEVRAVEAEDLPLLLEEGAAAGALAGQCRSVKLLRLHCSDSSSSSQSIAVLLKEGTAAGALAGVHGCHNAAFLSVAVFQTVQQQCSRCASNHSKGLQVND